MNDLEGQPVSGTDGLAYYHFEPDPLKEMLEAGPISIRDLTAYATKIFYERHGVGSDFTTPPELLPQIGTCYARLANRVHEKLGRPSQFTVYEAGAGNGTFARVFLDEAQKHTDLRDAISYHIIEQSPGLVAWQQERVAGSPLARSVYWHNEDVTQFAFPHADTGMYIAIENDDDLPSHAVFKRDGKPTEVYVVAGDHGPEDQELPAGEAVAKFVSDYPEWWEMVPESLQYPLPLHEASVRLRERFFSSVERGIMLTTDYGYDLRTSRLDMQDWAFSRYRMFRTNHNLFLVDGSFAAMLPLIGEGNLTSDVDFTLISEPGIKAGWHTMLGDNRALLDMFGMRNMIEQQFRRYVKLGELDMLRKYAQGVAHIIDVVTDWGTLIQWKGFDGSHPWFSSEDPQDLVDWYYRLTRTHDLGDVQPYDRKGPMR